MKSSNNLLISDFHLVHLWTYTYTHTEIPIHIWLVSNLKGLGFQQQFSVAKSISKCIGSGKLVLIKALSLYRQSILETDRTLQVPRACKQTCISDEFFLSQRTTGTKWKTRWLIRLTYIYIYIYWWIKERDVCTIY